MSKYIYIFYERTSITYRYELSIMQWAEPNAKDDNDVVSCLNSLTISTIKMCQKIFQFPSGGGGGGGVSHTAYTFQFSEYSLAKRQSTDLRQQRRRFGLTQWGSDVPIDGCPDMPLTLLLLYSVAASGNARFNYLFSSLQQQKLVAFCYATQIFVPCPGHEWATIVRVIVVVFGISQLCSTHSAPGS